MPQPDGNILVFGLNGPTALAQHAIQAGEYPEGVTAGPNDVITFTDFLNQDFLNEGNPSSTLTGGAFGLISKGSTTASFTQFDFHGNLDDEFEVNNATAIAVTPDGKYAFVVGYDEPDENFPSTNQGIPAFDPAGSNIGIVANPFTNPVLVAATRLDP